MAAASYIPTKLALAILNGSAPDLASDTLKCMAVVAGSGIPSTTKTGVEFVSDVTGSNTEVSGTGYSRQTLASKTWAVDGTATRQVDFGFGDITFSQNAAGPTNMRYFIIYKDTGSDATSQVILVFDPNTTYSMQTGDVVLSAPSGGALQATT
jgi:hypothetical protein